MAEFYKLVEFGSRLATSGITQTVLNTRIDPTGLPNNPVFPYGFIGYSVTQYQNTGVPQWAVEVHTEIGTGGKLIIAGVTAIGAARSGYLKAENLGGSTQAFARGFPRPVIIDVIGSSTTVGSSFGVVVGICVGAPS